MANMCIGFDKWIIGAATVGLLACGGSDSGGGTDTGTALPPGATQAPTGGMQGGAMPAGMMQATPATGTDTSGLMGTAGMGAAPDMGDDAMPPADDGSTDDMSGADDASMMDDMSMGDGDAMPMGDGMREDLGEGDGTDVVTIGDSYMNLSLVSGTEQSLEKVSGRTFRNYAEPGTRVLNGQIPGQYDRAKRDNGDIKTVIMTGGGNDVILDIFGNLRACQGAATEAELSGACVAGLTEISEGVVALQEQMAADGVQDIFYVGYGHVTNNELGGTIEWTKNRQMVVGCDGSLQPSGVRCHFVDPSEELVGTISPASGGDGIHPSNAGYDIIAEMVWAEMQRVGARR